MQFVLVVIAVSVVAAGGARLPARSVTECIQCCTSVPDCKSAEYHMNGTAGYCVIGESKVEVVDTQGENLLVNTNRRLTGKANSKAIKIGSISLYTGDSIFIITDDGHYWRRYWNVRHVLRAWKTSPDGAANHTVVTLDNNQFYLRADDNEYLHYVNPARLCGFFSAVRYEKTPMPTSVFVAEMVKDNTIRIRGQGQVCQYLERSEANFIMGAPKGCSGTSCDFYIVRNGLNVKSEKVLEVSFDLSNMTRSDRLVELHSLTIENCSPVKETEAFKFTKEIETTKTMTWEASFSISVTAGFSADVPVACEAQAGGTATTTATAHFSRGGAISDSDTTTFEVDTTITAPPGKIITAAAVTNTAKIGVPFTALVERVIVNGVNHEESYTYEVQGVYHGVNAYDEHVKITSEDCEV